MTGQAASCPPRPWSQPGDQGESRVTRAPGAAPQRSLEGGLAGMGRSPGRWRPPAGRRGHCHVGPRDAVKNRPGRQASSVAALAVGRG